jgi:acetolactate synthase-1/2/3 large subunit
VKLHSDGGTAILSAFHALGSRYVFCCSGSEWAAVWEAVARQRHEKSAGPEYIDVWHETVAVGMATGYGLVTGQPQGVLLHAGAGLLQGSMAVHGALLAGVPMVVMSAEALSYGEGPVDPGSQWYRNLSVVGGPRDMIRPAVKWAGQVHSVDILHESLIRAGEMSIRAPTGPVYLSAPVEVLQAAWTPPKTPRKAPPPGRRTSPEDEVAALAQRLVAAELPLVITETVGRDPGAFKALVELSELLALPVVEPQSAVCGNFPRSHPMHLGGAVEPFTDKSDLMLLVSCRAPWYPPSAKPPGAHVVVIDEVPQRPHIVYQVHMADAYLEGDVGLVLESLVRAVRALKPDAGNVEQRRARLAGMRKEQQDTAARAESKAAAQSAAIDPVLVATTLRELAGPEAIYLDETITHSRVLTQHLGLDRPGAYYYVQGGLGLGIAEAAGAKLAAPKRLVVLAIGDGSFMFNPVVPSLAALKNHRLPVLIVVFNNRQYLSMKFNLQRGYADGVALSTKGGEGYDLSTQPDLAEFARPYGMFGATVSSPKELRQVMGQAISAVREGRGALVNVMVSR